MAAQPTLAKLQRLNVAAALLHGFQAIVIIALANGFSLPVVASYMAGPPGSSAPRQLHTLFSLPIGAAVAAFFICSSLAHFLVAFPMRSAYEVHLGAKRDPYRWVEYSVSSSIMVLIIALITGIDDIAALIAVAGVNASMIGFGWIQERYEAPGKSLMPFWLGCGAGIAPWLAIGVYLIAPGAKQHAPGFVYAIFVSLFIFFNCFALVQYLQYRQVGRFKDYLVGERTYLVLSLVAKSLLAWQVFASTLSTGN
jgi:hypothetical protein